jgi:hypothetical protein
MQEKLQDQEVSIEPSICDMNEKMRVLCCY